MIMLKIATAIVAVAIAGSLLVVFAPDFSAYLALAVVSFFIAHEEPAGCMRPADLLQSMLATASAAWHERPVAGA